LVTKLIKVEAIKRILNGEICVACQASTKDNFLRQVRLLRLGSIKFFDQVPISLNESCLNHLQSYICRNCLQNLPILSHNKIWQSEKMRLQVNSLFSYQRPISNMIVQLKFYHKQYFAKLLAIFIFLLRQKFLLDNQDSIFVPIPLHQNRLKERGYNQAELIIKETAKLANLNFDNKLLLRTKITKKQTEVKGFEERQKNMSEAFVINSAYHIEHLNKFKKKQVVLFDDVLTTGSTIEAATKPLLKAGFKVKALTIAREDFI